MPPVCTISLSLCIGTIVPYYPYRYIVLTISTPSFLVCADMLIHNNISPHHLVTPVCTVPFPLQYQPQYSPAQQIANHSTKTRLLTTYPFLFLATHSMDHTVLIPMTNLWTYSLSLSYYDHRSTIPCHPRRYRQSHSPPPDNNVYIS